jgi:hypothetical protein
MSRDEKNIFKNFLLLSLMILAFFSFYLVHSHLGIFGSFPKTVDWAHTLALIETLQLDGGKILNKGNLGEMAVYPPAAHWIVAKVAQAFSLTTLQSLQIVCAFFLIFGCLIIAWQYWEDFKNNKTSLLIIALGLALTARMGFGIRGLILINFFFSQLIGTACALSLYLIFTKLLSMEIHGFKIWGLLYIFAVTYLLVFIHLNPALWFALACILAFVFKQKRHRERLAFFSFFLIGIMGVLLINPYFKKIIVISKINGGLGVIWGDLTTRNTIIGLVALLAIVLVLIIFNFGDLRKQSLERFSKYSGLLSVLVLVYSQLVVWFFNLGSDYAIKKWLPLLGILAPYLIGFIIEKFKITFTKLELKISKAPPWLVQSAVIILLFSANIPILRNKEDQTKYIEARETLLKWRYMEILPRKYPQFDFDPVVNYYLAIGVLGYPRDARTMQWFFNGTKNEVPLKLSEVHRRVGPE